MGYVKVFVIHQRLDKTTAYATNEQKTTETIMMEDGQERQVRYVDTVQCTNVEEAYQEMQETKRQWDAEDGVQGYHIIQSFKPGEVTPEQVHKIGMEFAQKICEGRFEAVVGTHLDQEHLHNHIVVNSVSFTDGKRFRCNRATFYQLRRESDEICRTHGLSVIEPKKKGKQYAQWKAEKQGKTTHQKLVMRDLDEIIRHSYTIQDFWQLLEKKGYQVKRGPNLKYTALKPTEGRVVRMEKLGPEYTVEAIQSRIRDQREKGPPKKPVLPPPKRYRMRGKTAGIRKKKVSGFMALYFKYLYLLQGTKKPQGRRPSYIARQELLRLERYQQQFKYVQANHIETAGDLDDRLDKIREDLEQLAEERSPLYVKKKLGKEEEKEEISKQIEQLTAAMRELRRERNLCRRIQEDIPRVQGCWEEAKAGLERKRQREQAKEKTARNRERRVQR